MIDRLRRVHDGRSSRAEVLVWIFVFFVLAVVSLRAHAQERTDPQLFQGLFQEIESRVAALEATAKNVAEAQRLAHEHVSKARDLLSAAQRNHRTVSGELEQINVFCRVAAALVAEFIFLDANFAERIGSLEVGLKAAAGMVSACQSSEDVAWAKKLYETGTKMVAEMVVKEKRAEKAQADFQKARAAPKQALATAGGVVQMIVSDGESAKAAADAAKSSADSAFKYWRMLRDAKAAVDPMIATFPNHFPPGREVAEAVASWNGRVGAAESAAESAYQAALSEHSTAQSYADQAEYIVGAARRELETARNNFDSCAAKGDRGLTSALASAAARTADAMSALYWASDLPARADVCLAKLDYNPLADPNLPSGEPTQVAGGKPPGTTADPPPTDAPLPPPTDRPPGGLGGGKPAQQGFADPGQGPKPPGTVVGQQPVWPTQPKPFAKAPQWTDLQPPPGRPPLEHTPGPISTTKPRPPSPSAKPETNCDDSYYGYPIPCYTACVMHCRDGGHPESMFKMRGTADQCAAACRPYSYRYSPDRSVHYLNEHCSKPRPGWTASREAECLKQLPPR